MKILARFGHGLLLAALLAGCGGGNSTSPAVQTSTTTATASVTTPSPIPSPSFAYTSFPYPGAVANSSSPVTGIRGITGSTDVFITGYYKPPGGTDNGFLYTGPVLGGGTFRTLAFPSTPGATVNGTALYGPNNGPNGGVQIAGNYTTVQAGMSALGLFYQGPVDGSGTWTTLLPPTSSGTVLNTIAHSTMGGLVVGNFDTDLATGRAFIYDVANNTYFELTKPNAVSITAYGIWWNGGTSYTIAGGYSNANAQGLDIGYLVDYDSATQTTANWTSYSYKNQPLSSIVSHIEGITSDGSGGYNLATDWAAVGNGGAVGAALAHVSRLPSGGLGVATWFDISYPSSPGATVIANSANTAFENYILGVFVTSQSSGLQSMVATFSP